jgi:PKD repeat protein
MIKKILFLIALMGFMQLNAVAINIIVEAETGILHGNTTVAKSTSGYSGTGYVTGFQSSTDSATVTVNVSKADTYMLSIGYCTPYGEKTNYISVNGTMTDTVYFPPSSSFTELTCNKSIYLKAGNNTISFISFWGWMLLDYFKIGGVGPTGSFTITPTLPGIADTVVFDASKMIDPNGTIVNYSWNFGDGTTDKGMIVKHQYIDKGYYSAQLTATDNDGNEARKSMTIQVVNGNPVAMFSYSQVNYTTSVQFTNLSLDENGSITTSEWDFGDGAISDETSPKHTYANYGNYLVKLTVTDNNGKKQTKATSVRVYDSNVKIRGFSFDDQNIITYTKAEASFEIKGTYSNPYDPDEVMADAIIKSGNDSLVIPCFYYEESRYDQESWIKTNSEKIWKLRYTPKETGTHKAYIRIKDASGTTYSDVITFNVTEGSQNGFIGIDATDKQQFRKNTGQMYLPVGNNLPWTFSSSGNDRMAEINKQLSSISENGGNWIRYWFASFAGQALEWTGSDYPKLGQYNQQAAALLDSMLNNCNEKGINMQLVFYHHGMFSKNVDAEWASNPYNTANGGILDDPAKFFTDANALKYAKRMARYVVARWGFSQNIFNWELFNEVNFTGTGTNSTAQKTNIANWHDSMSQYIKSIDPNKHLITTSSSGDNDQLILMKDCKDMDLLEFHVYSNDPITEMKTQVKNLKKYISKPLLCGEWGIGSAATTSDSTLRSILWSSYMNKVPAFYWYWDETLKYGQHCNYKAISKLFSNEDPQKDIDTTIVSPDIYKTSSNWFTTGKHGKKTWYAFVSASENTHSSAIIVKGINFGYYKALILDATTGDTLQFKETPIIDTDQKLYLPAFKNEIAIRLMYDSAYTMPIAIAGDDQIKYYESTITVDGSGSLDPGGKTLTYSWSFISKPTSSKITLSNPKNASFNLMPDIAGEYSLSLVVSNGTQTSVADTVVINAVDRPIANAGEDTSGIIKKLIVLDGNKSYDPAGFPLTYSWSIVSAPSGSTAEISGPKIASTKFRPILEGKYIITLVVDNGYASSLPDSIVISALLTGIDFSNIASKMKIFPNPAAQYIEVGIPAEWKGETTISFIDNNGKKVASRQVVSNGSNFTIQVPTVLRNGIYFVQLESGNNILTTKLIIER